ncbi:MAG: hypothetical protein WAO12_02325 [Venatoribacter sp.]
MNIKVTSPDSASPKGLEILQALREAVTAELEKKKLLGQSAVIWRDGKTMVVDAETALRTTPPAPSPLQ